MWYMRQLQPRPRKKALDRVRDRR
nr:unnamed protein product [Callosobruchus chinensis]